MNHRTSRVLLRSLIALLGLALLIACGACSKKKSSGSSSSAQTLKQHLTDLPVPKDVGFVVVIDGSQIPAKYIQSLEAMLVEQASLKGADKAIYEALKGSGFAPDKFRRLVLGWTGDGNEDPSIGYIQCDFDVQKILDWAGKLATNGLKPTAEVDGIKMYISEEDGTLVGALDKNTLIIADDQAALEALLKTRKGEHGNFLENPAIKPLVAKASKGAAVYVIGNPPSGGQPWHSLQISAKVSPTIGIDGQLGLKMALPPQVQPVLANFDAAKPMIAQMVPTMMGQRQDMPSDVAQGMGTIVADFITNTSLQYDAGTNTIAFQTKSQTSLDKFLDLVKMTIKEKTTE